MAKQISRLGDWTTGRKRVRPHKITSGVNSVLVNGFPVSVNSSSIKTSSNNVLVNGVQINHVGAPVSSSYEGCLTGSPNVFLGSV
jgi:hypothetical protein